jgi:tetratricopeptide (TPR) repeat protein
VRNHGLDLDHSGLNKFSSRTEDYLQFVAVLKEMMPKQAPHSSFRTTSNSWLPAQLAVNFTPRNKLMGSLHEKLHMSRKSASIPHSVTVFGIGGSGKTQLALKYLETYGQEYSHIFWINGQDEISAKASFESICRRLSLDPEICTAQSTADIRLKHLPLVHAVLERLLFPPTTSERRLIVIDDVNDFSWGIRDVLPRGPNGSLLILSRDARSTFLAGGQELEVQGMEIDEAVQLLLGTTKTQLIQTSLSLRKHAEEVVVELECLPLAVDLARAYITTTVNTEVTEDSLQDYLAEFRSHRDVLLEENPLTNLTTYDKTVKSVWSTTFDAIQSANPTSKYLFILLAYLNRDHLVDELFSLASAGLESGAVTLEFLTKLPKWLLDLISRNDDHLWDKSSFRKALHPLLNYNMIRAQPSGSHTRYYMHGLIQWRARSLGNEEDWLRVAFRFIALAIHGQNLKRDFREHIWPHVTEISNGLERYLNSEGPEVGRYKGMEVEISAAGLAFHNAGLYALAQQFQCVLVMPLIININGEFSFNSSDINSLRTFRDWTLTQIQLGNYDTAVTTLVQVGNRMEYLLGELDSEVLSLWSNLAHTFALQGNQADSEAIHQGLFIRSQYWLLPNDRITLEIRYRLAMSLSLWGYLDDALKLLSEVVRTQEEALGQDDGDTILSKEELVRMLHSYNRSAEATPLEADVLAWRLKHRPNDAKTLDMAYISGKKLIAGGRWVEAERLFQYLAGKFSLLSGEIELQALFCRMHLATCYTNQNKPEQAEEILIDVLGSTIRTRGWDTCDTVTVWVLLSRALSGQNRLVEAESYLSDACKIYSEGLCQTMGRIECLQELFYLQLRLRKLEAISRTVGAIVDHLAEAKKLPDPGQMDWQGFHNLWEHRWKNQPDAREEFIDNFEKCELAKIK